MFEVSIVLPFLLNRDDSSIYSYGQGNSIQESYKLNNFYLKITYCESKTEWQGLNTTGFANAYIPTY